MAKKPTYEELEKRVKELQKETFYRKQADEALRKSEREKTDILNTMSELVAYQDTDHTVLWTNQAAAESVHKNQEDLKGRKCYEIWPGRKERCEICPISRAIGTGETQGDEIPTPDGRIWHIKGYPIKNETGEIIGAVEVTLDITERKRAEEALRESEEKFSKLFQASPVYISLATLEDGRFLDVNEAFTEITGYRREEVIGRTSVDVGLWPEPNQRKELVGFAREHGGYREQEVTLRRKNGEPLIGLWSAKKMELGGETCLISVLIDITERKQAQEALRDSRNMMQAVLDSIPSAVFWKDRDSIYVGGNRTWLEAAGLRSLEEVVGKSDYDLPWEKEQTDSFREDDMRVMESGIPEHGIVEPYLRADGTHAWARTNKVPLRDKEGNVTGVLGTFEDITEQLRADEAMQESEEKYRSLVESTEDSVYLLDRNCRYLFMNKKHLSRVDLQLHEVTERTYAGLHSEKESKDFSLRVSNVLQTGKSVTYEYRSERDGKYFLRSLSPVKDPDGRVAGMTIISKDITGRKRAEEELRRSNEELLKEHNQRMMLSKSLIELLEKDRQQIAMELHDHIGQTLTSLKMNLEMVHGKLQPDHRELETQITVVQERTIQAIKDVKNVSHGLWPATIDALGVVSSLRELFNEIQQATDMEIHFFSQGIPVRFEKGKELAIYRIAQEALNNIIRHARAKHVFVNLVKKDENLSLSVEDDGVGFDQNKVMKPSKKKGPLGLLIMRERAVQLDGEFTVESQIGKGTHLLVEIPI